MTGVQTCALPIWIDLPAQTVTVLTSGRSEHFEINAYKKQCLTEGLDDIGYLLAHAADIDKYENETNS